MRPIFRTLFIIAALLAAMSPALARADVLHYVEDFSDDAGNPASDPMFNHSCMIDDPEGTKWDITSYLLDTNPLGESIRGRLVRVYDAAQIAQFRRHR